MNWLFRLFRRSRPKREIEEELQFHMDEHTRDLMAAGVDAVEARRIARSELTTMTSDNAPSRNRHRLQWLDDLRLDVALTLRRVRRAPGFSASAAAIIAIGVGANIAVFSVADALLLRTLPVTRPDQLHSLRRVGIDDDHERFSHVTFTVLKASLDDYTDVTAMSALARMYATLDGQPEGILVQLIDGNWFGLLGVGTSVGRPLSADDDASLGGHPVAVLSNGFWTRQFGRDPSVVGSTIRVNNILLTIIGVAEPGFFGLTVGREVDLWAPIAMQHELNYRTNVSTSNASPGDPWVPQRGIEWLTLVARIPDSIPATRVETGVNQLFRTELEELHATRDSTTREFLMRERVVLPSLARGQSPIRDQFANPLAVLMTSVALVLIIACANLASLLVARSSRVAHEHAVQLSLGARPWRLARQSLTESLVLAVTGGLLSLTVAGWGGRMLLQAASTSDRGIPLSLSLDARLLAFAAGVSVVTGLVLGLAPAIYVARTDLSAQFSSAGRLVGSHTKRFASLGKVLVVSQLSLSLVLATCAGLFARTVQNLIAIDPGYERDQVVLARIDVRAAGYTVDELPALYQRLDENVRSVPGVRSASLSVTGLAFGSRSISSFRVPGQTRGPEWDNSAQENIVSPDFFATVGLPILHGRGFDGQAVDSQLGRVLVNEAMARDFFGTLDVVGEQFGYGDQPRFEIIGVVRDARVNELQEAPPRMVYHELQSRSPWYVSSIEVRFEGVGAVESSGEAIRTAIRTVDPDLPIREVTPLADLLERGLRSERFLSRLVGLFGILALLLTAVGLYGVTSYGVSQRTNEMGVRMALGAPPTSVRILVLRDTILTLSLGLSVGAIVLLPTVSLIRTQIYGLSPYDPWTLLGAVVLLTGVGIVATLLPAWKASRVDPVSALRAD